MGLRIFVVPASAMVTDHRPHGDGLVAFGFIRELAARGHDLHVAAGIVDVQGALPPNVHLYALRQEDGLGWAERLRFMWRVRRLYRRLTRSTAFDLVHQLTPVDVGVSLALADCSAPLVLGPYVPDWPPSGAGADAVVRPAALRLKRVIRAAQQSRATTVLLSTPAAASKLELRERGRLHVHDLPLGVDADSWHPDHRESGQDVLFLASLEVRKGIHVLLDAFAQLVTQLPDARLLIGGRGAELDEVRRRIRASASLDRVELLGHVERDRAMAIMQDCDVYCLPSYGDPCPLAAVEAMACARPVVATDAGGLRYLVPDEGGFKVPPGDATALAGALRDVLADPGMAGAMGAHNRTVVEERYAWSRVVDGLEDLYGEAIREPRATLTPASLRRR